MGVKWPIVAIAVSHTFTCSPTSSYFILSFCFFRLSLKKCKKMEPDSGYRRGQYQNYKAISHYHLISRETVNQIIKDTWIVFQYLWSSHSRDSISFKHISWHWVICQLILTSTVSSLPISNPQRSENLFWREAPTARTLPLEALSFSKKRIASQVSISS